MTTQGTYQLKLIIKDEERDASTRETKELLSPATGEVIATYPLASQADVGEAVERAQEAFIEWSAKSAYEREKIIRKAAEYARREAYSIGRLMALEQGKPFNQCRSEVLASCDTLDYFAAEGVRLEGYTNQTEKPNLRSTVIYQPVGVCGLITPWNYPVSLLSWKLGPALAVGCTTVVKPTSTTPLSPTAFCKALLDGGIPDGVINVITGSGSTVGEALIRNKAVKKIAMTGSSATGKRLMELYAPSLNKISLELGGQCPAVVCSDADVKLSAKVISYKGFRNMGQSCSSVNRVFVHESIAAELLEELKSLAASHTIGDGLTDPSVDLGPMVSREALENVKAHIQDALSKGAVLEYGGKPPEGDAYSNGNYYLPTILTGATRDMLVMREETFGPVVAVSTFSNLNDAILRANDSEYGLVSYAFTESYKTATRLSEELEAGTVCINNGAVNTNYGPYAGWKQSGYGLELSRRAIFEYVNTKHIKIQI